jgi:hypothetical protein
MRWLLPRRLMAAALVALATLCIGIAPASAATRVGPHQIFVGLVNHQYGPANIAVGCVGPIRPGETGPVVGGQTVEILPAPSTASTAGYTGSAGRRVVVSIVVPVVTPGGPQIPITLTEYGKPAPIPTSLMVPCSGSGIALFTPEPTSKTARSASVPVRFVSIGVAATSTGPHIVARPVDVMVDKPVALHGTGFPRNRSLVLTECSQTEWSVPQNPCLSDNQVTVHTNGAGAFLTSMKAEICPATTPPPPQTERTCYIGVAHPSGVDTMTLVGAAKIVVSWP